MTSYEDSGLAKRFRSFPVVTMEATRHHLRPSGPIADRLCQELLAGRGRLHPLSQPRTIAGRSWRRLEHGRACTGLYQRRLVLAARGGEYHAAQCIGDGGRCDRFAVQIQL